MHYLFDTNTCISLMRNKPAVLARMAAVSPEDCAISTITSYELYTGVQKCSDPGREAAKVRRLLSVVRALPFDTAAAEEGARIRAELECQGCVIGPYDLLLAGHAVAAQLTLVTANTDEFSRVRGLRIEDFEAKR